MSEPTSSSNSSGGDKVAFVSVPGSYKAGESVQVRYKLSDGLVTHSRDWIGLFKVGWTSNRDYYTFEWAPLKKEGNEIDENERVVKFSGSRLPPDDGVFYQFCYVVYAGSIKGASRPFQFSNIPRDSYADDLEVVEVNDEDSLLLLRSRHETELSELHKRVEQLRETNVEVEASFVQVKSEHDKLVLERNQLEDQNKALNTKISEAKKVIVSKDHELAKYAQLFEEYNQKEVELNGLFEAKQQEVEIVKKMKDEMKQELDDVTARIQQLLIVDGKKEDELKLAKEMNEKLRNEKEAIIAEKLESETQLRIQCSQLEERQRKLEEEKEALAGRSEYYQAESEAQYQRMEVMKVQISTLECEVNGLAQALDKEKNEHHALHEKLLAKEQEYNVLQQNFCEVVGNIKEPRDQLPPDSLQADKVDRSALEALQMAYEDIEKRLKMEQKQGFSLRKKVTELETRITLCQEEFTRVASENNSLQKKLKKQGGMSQLEHELEVFQLKHDERIAEKNEVIQKLNGDLTTKSKEIDDLKGIITGIQHQEKAMKRSIETLNVENEQLKRQLRERAPPRYTPSQPPPYNPSYGPNARPVHPPAPQRPQQPQQPRFISDGSRVCPMCGLAYPSRASQSEFEAHVNSHLT